MSERRMFTMKIVDSDAFLDMPLSAQSLYFHLNMRADDDGFVNNPKKIQRMIGASDDDLRLLVAKRFILVFDNGVIVIKHWRMHNLLRKDRYNATQYQEQFALLELKENGAYTERNKHVGNQLATNWQPTDNQLATQDSIGKDSIDKNNNIYGDFPSEKYADCETFFSKIWKLYPKKRGKGQVSAKAKRKLYEIGIDHITRCIDRYKEEIKGKDEQYIMYGSTFFNSGYMDYLDENYEKAESKSDFNIDDWGNDE